MHIWGWVALIFGVLQVLAGVRVLTGNQFARWSGVAVVALNSFGQFFFIPAYPFWSLTSSRRTWSCCTDCAYKVVAPM